MFPRIYGPLIETGMSLREINRHTRAEIYAMKNALVRYKILSEGQGITPEMRKGDINAQLLYRDYENEVQKYVDWVERRGVKNGKVSDE